VSDPGSWWQRQGVSPAALEHGVPGANALERLPARTRPEPAYRATVREIQARTRELRGRTRELREVVEFSTSSERYRWLIGGAWTGKTALLAAAVAALPDEVQVVSYFLSRREADADQNRFLAAVVAQLAYLLDHDPPVAERDHFRDLWQRACSQVEDADQH